MSKLQVFFAVFPASDPLCQCYVEIRATSRQNAAEKLTAVYGQRWLSIYSAKEWAAGGATLAERHDLLPLQRLLAIAAVPYPSAVGEYAALISLFLAVIPLGLLLWAGRAGWRAARG